MNIRRTVVFFVTVILTFAVILTTTPAIMNGLKLGLDLKGGFEILYEAKPVEEGTAITCDALLQTARMLEQRADAYGVAEPEVTPEGEDRIRARIAGVSNEEQVREMMRKPAELTFRGPDGTIEMRGIDFKEGAAEVGFDEINRPIIHIEVKDPHKLRQVSEKLLGQPLKIYLDEEQISAPIIQHVLPNGNATISGSFTREEAQELADIINLGALPLQLTEKYTQSVGATLGQQSLEQTVTAGVIASILILLFMVGMYRVPGIIASITLITYTWALLLIFDWMNATLTLPGIAAFVLGIGMAVDANIITYERIKDELKSGKSIPSAMKVGSRQSLRTILDSNITTILAGVVLYYLGTGAIQGFALTLILSIVLSMVTNVFMSRWLLQQLIRSGMIRRTEWLGVKASEIGSLSDSNGASPAKWTRAIDFVKWKKPFFLISLMITAVGIVSLMVFQLNLGVDFKAGTSLDVTVGKEINREQAQELFKIAGHTPASLTVGGNPAERVSARFDRVLTGEEIERIMDVFRDSFGEQSSAEENTVDPGIARELAQKAIYAVAAASVGIALYVSLRFEWRFALAAIIAIMHDAFMVIGAFSLFRLEVNLPFVAAVLTIIGYSINDTIVIFDRIRENMAKGTQKSAKALEDLVNSSIQQTLTRSINTGITVLFASLILFLFGSESIKLFSLAMTLGLVFGVYSSICIASQIWLVLKKRSMHSQSVTVSEP
ncbi:protein translocase subunit SecDF [Xylanibacillus composti]|uniref:Multifunctional fusion protein n=1 Tax=Xylanibacillus composti TaxID=1572762 RepID=A0A8J4H2D6_9BACL|nr:protein translocase subunit SecD [Xylanibacillus composti]GIQ69688.1 protein translocase subunit SecDF [Xylanibacillus composti]